MKKIKKIKKVKTFNISIPFTDKYFGFYIQDKKSPKRIVKRRVSVRSKKRNINYKIIERVEMIALALLFVVGGYWAYVSVPAVKEAITLATTIKPETFTELYFENNAALPNKITATQENKFKFTVHNLEYKTMTYPYEVYIKCSGTGCNGEKQIIDKGEITLKQGEYKTVPESFTLAQSTGKIEVIANLINKNQAIDFWAVGGEDATTQLEVSQNIVQPVLSSTPTPTVIQPKVVQEITKPVLLQKTIQPVVSPMILQPELFTTLYFNYQPPLPLTVTAGQVVNFAFTVHDYENQDVTYPYDVYIEENGQTTQIDNGQFSLRQNEYKTITEAHTMTVVSGALARVHVRLNNENKFIYFEVKGL